MPINQTQFSIGTVATQIVRADNMSQHVVIHNHEHSANSNIYIGGAGVTIANGVHAPATETTQLDIGPGDSLWAVADTANCDLHVMVIKQD